MSLAEFADQEMAMMEEAQAAAAAAALANPPPSEFAAEEDATDEAADEATYKARAMDECVCMEGVRLPWRRPGPDRRGCAGTRTTRGGATGTAWAWANGGPAVVR